MAEGGHGSDEPLPKVRRSSEAAERKDEAEVHEINIEHLPDELMLNIFSSFSFNDLIDSVQNVCTRWRRLAHDPVLWCDKEYIIVGRSSTPKGRSCCGVVWSKCIHCRYEGKDKKILQTAAVTPQLRKLTLARRVKASVLETISTNWPNLTSLKIHGRQDMQYALMKHIFEKCPKIQKLKLGTNLVVGTQWEKLLSTLEHLSSLVLIPGEVCHRYVSMRALADACPRLEEIDVQCDDHDVDDTEYFLKAKRQSLTSATLFWTLGRIESICVVPLLKKCHRLRKLQLSYFHKMRDRMHAAAFEALGELHSLQDLSIREAYPRPPRVMARAFQPGCLTQLQRLELVTTDLEDETVLAISRNCPNLCELRLKNGDRTTDRALSELHHLEHLKILELSIALTGDAVAHIAELPALHTLILKQYDLTDLQPSLQLIVNMKELQCLAFLKCWNIQAVPFNEFPDTLVKLRELRVTWDYDYDEEEDEDEEELFCKSAIAHLQRKMPHLRVFNTSWLRDDQEPDDSDKDKDYECGSCDSGDSVDSSPEGDSGDSVDSSPEGYACGRGYGGYSWPW